MEILKMGRQELLSLDPKDVRRWLTPEEVVHMAKTLEAFWTYDYEAAKQGKVGLHARLKSERHSDGFFVSRIMLHPWNILYVMARQIVMRLQAAGVPKPDYVAGIPDGATELGEVVTWMLSSKPARMSKTDGRIYLDTPLETDCSLLLVEDFCTRGTGFTEAVRVVKENHPSVYILPYDPVIINRGGLKEIVVEGVGIFKIVAVVENRIEDWEPAECPLCKLGSKPIKPKETEYNWQAITTSQL